MDKLEQAKQILEEVLPKYFTFRLFVTETNQDGSFTQLYTEKSDEIFKDLLKILEKE